MSRHHMGSSAASVATAAFAAIIALGATATTAPAAVISESFTVGDGTGVAGTDLNGTAVENGGGATWVANTSIDFTADGTIERNGSSSNNSAAFPITLSPSESLLTLTASINPDDSANAGNFLAVGFTDNTDLQPFWSAGGAEVWIHVRDGGTFEVYASAVSHLLATGAAPNFVADGFNSVELRLDRSTNQVTALINGVVVVNAYDLDNKGFTPNIGAVGFFMFSNESEVDNVTVSGVSVPEPATGMGLIGVGAAGLAIARRRRA